MGVRATAELGDSRRWSRSFFFFFNVEVIASV